MQKSICFALAVAAAGAAAAQDRRPDPQDPQAKAPPVAYRSAFEGYRSYAETELAPWRALNEEVGRVGGHLGILRRPGQAADRGAHKDGHGERK